MNHVIIAGSGPSIKDLDPKDILESGAHVIAVNGAIDWLQGADSWFTLDPSFKNIRRMENPLPGVRYYAAVDRCHYKLIPQHVTKLHRISNPSVRTRPLYTPNYWFLRWGCRAGLSDQSGAINSGNSAYGALGLAYQWKPDKILLLGVDGSSDPRVSGDGPPDRSLSHLPQLFNTAVDQLEKENIQVINGSKKSAITCFEKNSPGEGLEWIRQK